MINSGNKIYYGGRRIFRQRKCKPKDRRRRAGQGYLGRRQGELRRRRVTVRQCPQHGRQGGSRHRRPCRRPERGRDAPRAGCHGHEGHGLPAHLQAARPGHRCGHPPRDDTPVPRRAHASPLCRGSPSSAGLHRGGGLFVHPPASDSGTDGRRRQREARRGGPYRADDGRRDAGCHRQDRRLHPARGCIHTHAEHPAHPHGRRLGGPFSGDTQEQRPRLHGQPDGARRRDALLGRRRAPAPRLQRRGHTERAQGSGHVPAHGCHQPDTSRQADTHQPGSRPSQPHGGTRPQVHGGVRAFLQEKDQEAGGQAAQQGQQDDKERIPQEHAPQGHLYGHWPPRGRGQRHVLHRRGGLLARRPGTSVMGTHMVQPQRLPGSSGQRVAPRLRHGRRRGHGRRHPDAPHE
ncbi:putative Rhs domain protein [Bacteroides fragilis str. S36L5]|nr:putative Rhs domain protein [Bacteroides fragilis str. S36L12]EYA93412.1 putative Rhs domain protein [Bacteroides fragilis str. S36L5]